MGRVETTRYPADDSQTWKSELGKAYGGRPRRSDCVEKQVQKLGLNDQTCAMSDKLKQWCERNKDRCYIPEWLLKRLRISVDPNVSG